MLLPKNALLPKHFQDNTLLRVQETCLQVVNFVASTIDTLKVILLRAGSWGTDGKPGCGV